jgi:hypothetical protein
MRKFLLMVALLAVLVVLVGMLGLALWQPAPPTQPMEKAVPNARLSG